MVSQADAGIPMAGPWYTHSNQPSLNAVLIDSALRLVVETAVLDYRDLGEMLQAVELRLPTCLQRIEVDFSKVREFRGPWGVHFAMLLKLSRDRRVPVRAVGLAGQPLALANMFSCCQPVAALTSKSHLSNPESRFAAA